MHMPAPPANCKGSRGTRHELPGQERQRNPEDPLQVWMQLEMGLCGFSLRCLCGVFWSPSWWGPHVSEASWSLRSSHQRSQNRESNCSRPAQRMFSAKCRACPFWPTSAGVARCGTGSALAVRAGWLRNVRRNLEPLNFLSQKKQQQKLHKSTIPFLLVGTY